MAGRPLSPTAIIDSIPKGIHIRKGEKAIIQHSPIAHLPGEILFELLDFVPEASIITLSLTCKALYQTLLPRTRPLLSDRPTIDQFLALYLIDQPPLSHCPSCAKVYRWHKGSQGLPYSPCPRSLVANPDKGASYLHKFLPNIHLDKGFRNHLLRAHKYGPKYGPPLSALERTISEIEPASSWLQINARVIGGRLVLRHIYAFIIDPNPTKHGFAPDQISHFIKEGLAHPCALWHLEEATADCFLQLLQSPSHLAHGPWGTYGLSTRLLRCRYCATDTKIEVSEEKSSTLKFRTLVTSYLDFGGLDTCAHSAQGKMLSGLPGLDDHLDEALCRNLEDEWNWSTYSVSPEQHRPYTSKICEFPALPSAGGTPLLQH